MLGIHTFSSYVYKLLQCDWNTPKRNLAAYMHTSSFVDRRAMNYKPRTRLLATEHKMCYKMFLEFSTEKNASQCTGSGIKVDNEPRGMLEEK